MGTRKNLDGKNLDGTDLDDINLELHILKPVDGNKNEKNNKMFYGLW